MDRREFLISTGSGAAAAALAGSVAGTAAVAQPLADGAPAAPSIATGRQTLSFSMPWADTGRGLGDSARRLGLRIHEATDGRISFALMPAGAGAQVMHGPAYPSDLDHSGEARAVAYFAGLPGDAGLPVADQLAWLSVGGGQMLWDDLAADRGVKSLAVGHTGERGLIFSKTRVETLTEAQGLKVAVMGPAGDVARGLGLETLALTSPGEADLVDAGGALLALASDVPKTHAIAIDGGLSARGTLLSLDITLEVWEGLHPGDRVRITHAAEAELQASLAEARAHDAMVRGVLASSFGVAFMAMPQDIAAARNRVAEAVVAHIAASGPKAQRINQSFQAFKSLVTGAIA